MSSTTPLHLARRIDRLKSSLVRDILAAATRPGVISFAGGLPAADLMPTLPIAAAADPALNHYGNSEGEPAYRAAVAAWVGEAGLQVEAAQIIATTGSQQGLDLATKLLVDEGTPLLCESPSYLAALQNFELFGADILGVPLTADGPDLAAFEALLATRRPRAAYLIPTFQNPSGICYSEEARRAVAELLDRYEVILIEDEPYRCVRFNDAPMTPVCAYLRRARWIYLGSFSKILWPGWRVGFIASHPDLFDHLLHLKQASDLHSSRPGQMAVAHWLDSATREADLQALRDGYRLRRDAMQRALQRHLGDLADWQLPQGGLFFWLKLRDGIIATRETMYAALRHDVAFMPGEAFFSEAGAGRSFVRLNYSRVTPEDMERGLARLAECLRASVVQAA